MNILVRPKNNDGSIEHYNHFLFGYLLPFIQNENFNMNNNYFFYDCGKPMNKILEELSLNIIDSKTNIDKIVSYKGFDKYYENINIKKIQKIFFKKFNIRPEKISNNKILVIDRAEPDDFFTKKAKVKGSGKSRRSIPNIDELCEKLSLFFNVKKIILENIKLKDQILEFNSANKILLQHGAAMSNLIWCNPGSYIFEINSNPKYYWVYEKLINLCSLRSRKILQKNDHSPIDIKNTLKVILKLMN